VVCFFRRDWIARDFKMSSGRKEIVLVKSTIVGRERSGFWFGVSLSLEMVLHAIGDDEHNGLAVDTVNTIDTFLRILKLAGQF